METLVDDVGSFPLPKQINKEEFSQAYHGARIAIQKKQNISNDSFLNDKFQKVVIDAFKKKIKTGLDVINYPQQYDGIKQIGDLIHKAMEEGTFIVDEKSAVLPEVQIIYNEAKNLYEEFGKKILLRVSFFGPLEQYLKEVGITIYQDVLENFAKTVLNFAKNSIFDTKYIKTQAISIDEPSFGFININAEKDAICEILEKALDFKGVTRQIHLHSASRLPDLLEVKNLDVLSFEYGASPKNIEAVSKKILAKADKQIRVGISRTDIDTIIAELIEKNIHKPTIEQLVENEQTIKKRYIYAKTKYEDRLAYTGPDCGLGSWPDQESAELLLKRTVKAVKNQ